MPDNRIRKSPVSVKSLLLHGGTDSDIYIITGHRGAGKTKQCQKILMEALFLDLKVRGLISSSVFEADQKTGIELVNIADQETQLLAKIKANHKEDTCRWSFFSDTVEWGNQVLRNISDCDVLIIDELGPKELKHGEGLKSAFDLVDAKRYQLAFIVIRPKLVEQALGHWPEAIVIETPQHD